jgi:hypothetical protein
LIEYIERFVDTPADFKWSAHGPFGKLSRNQWNILAYKASRPSFEAVWGMMPL